MNQLQLVESPPSPVTRSGECLFPNSCESSDENTIKSSSEPFIISQPNNIQPSSEWPGKQQDSTTKTPWSSLGYLIARRTYARHKDDGSIEQWKDIVDRVLRACDEQLKCGFTAGEQGRLRSYLNGLKCSVAGRFLWQLGTNTVSRLGLASLQNCAFVTVDKPEAFTWAFDFLMLGSGVGFNIQREYVNQLPPVRDEFKPPVRRDDSSADFIVPDTREGWVRLLDNLLKSATSADRRGLPEGFSYSTHCVRGKGTPIRGFGGIASGPEELCSGVGEIARVLEERRGKQLRPIDCLDIMNLIGQIVVSGNVRRSAQIAIGDYDDVDFLRAKRWDTGTIPSWRSMSNNSVVCEDTALLPEEFWEGYRGNGEPYGLINLRLARLCGRLGETQYPDPNIMGFNPCAEQGLEDFETCCLATIFLPNVESRTELRDIIQLLYRVNKHSLTLPCHQPKTQQVVSRNMRMGISVTGYLQASEEQRGWLSGVYNELRDFDVEYSRRIGCPPSIKLTTVQPSGTLSLLPGVVSGCHPAFSQYMVRRVRLSADAPLVDVCREHGYSVEYQRNFDGSEDLGTCVVSFPFSYPEGTKLAAEMTALDQLEVVKRLQTEWSDNAVSCTIYFKDEELPAIREYLTRTYRETYKSLSFLRYTEHGFDQAPLEEITKEEYEEMVRNTRPITELSFEFNMDYAEDCEATGVCPIR